MKSLFIWVLLALACFAEPTIDCEVRDVPQMPGQMVIIIEGNQEVKSLRLVSPIDPQSYREFGEKKMIFVWPDGLPIYPTLFFLVNGKELHYIPQLKASDFMTKSKDPV